MGSLHGSRRRQALFLILHKLSHILRAAGLDAGTQSGFAHPAKGLAQRDGSGGSPVNIQIAGFDLLRPVVLFTPVEACDTGSQSVAGLVDHFYGLLEIFGRHHPQQGAEKLRHVGGAARFNAPLDPGGPHVGIAGNILRFQGPGFTGFQFRQSFSQVIPRGMDQWPHFI